MARKNVIALLDNQPELGRGFKAQMARRRPVSRSEYRNAQRVTGKKDVDLADVRDIRARGIKAPVALSRPRRNRKTRTAPAAPKKKVSAPQYPTVNSRPVDDDPTKAHLRTGGRVGEAPKPRAEFDPSRTPPPLGGFRQKVKVDEHGGVSANETPKPKTLSPADRAQFDVWDKMRENEARKHDSIQPLNAHTSRREKRNEVLSSVLPNASLGAQVGVLGAAINSTTAKGKNRFKLLTGFGGAKPLSGNAIITTGKPFVRDLVRRGATAAAGGAVLGPAHKYATLEAQKEKRKRK